MNKLPVLFKTTKVTPSTKSIIRLSSISTSNDGKIEIPKRIPREPTDILRALESTITTDPTATHYKYHDDPYLIPMSNIGKRTFSLAQEAGRKAAHWIREQHPELFQHKECDPLVEKFLSKTVYNDNSVVTEEDLKKVIENVLVSDAILIYKMLKDRGNEISNEVLGSLLDLLCFYNNEDTLNEEFIEERWYRQSSRGKEKLRKTWKDSALAEEIFISMENPSEVAYSSLIQGMAKYYQVDRAYQLFEEAQEKGLVLNTEAYNSIIRVANFLKEAYDLRWSFVLEMLAKMNVAKVKPNLGTLNAVLEIISTLGVGKVNKENALKVLKEFRDLSIEPSLASWYFLLITYCKDRGPVSHILKDILPMLENKKFMPQDPKDTFFFVTAMDICRNHMNDKDMAQRVNNLLHYGNNYDLIGDSFKESIYYRHYFILLCETEPLDVFMETIYFKLVPHIYTPEPAVMFEILKHVEMNAAITYLPKLWSDMTIFDHIDRENLLNITLDIMMANEPKPQSDLHEKFSDIAWGIWSKIVNQNENRIQKLSFTGEMLGNIMSILLRNNDYEKACTVMNKLDKGHHTVAGVPKIDALNTFIEYSIKEGMPTKAIQCIQYSADCGFPEAASFALKIDTELTLNEEHRNALIKIVGHNVLKR